MAALALALLNVLPARADHEPLAYSYSGAASRERAVQFSPAQVPRPLSRERQDKDPLIKKKLDDLLDSSFSTAIAALALDGDHIVYERYRRGDEGNAYPAWSMTKSLVSLAVGHALCQGHVKSLDDPAERYAKDLAGTVWGRATLRQLLQMRSGSPRQDLDRGGDYLYAGTSSGVDMVGGRLSMREVHRRFDSKGDKAAPGERFAYANMDTDALGLVVAAATGQPFHAFFAATVLAGARLEHMSVFHLDRDGHAVTHAYYFATLRDLARLGRYVVDLHHGRVEGRCLQAYMVEALSAYTEGTNSVNRQSLGYGYQFWLDTGMGPTRTEAVRMSGHQGQDIYLNLRTGKVVVLLGWRARLRDLAWQAGSVGEWLTR